MSDLRVGWIGLGAMGHPMALHLLRAGHPLAVWAQLAALVGHGWGGDDTSSLLRVLEAQSGNGRG